MSSNIEYWYDSHHTGALRVIDYNKHLIYGSDPKELYWVVSFTLLDNNNNIIVDFHNKKTHYGKVFLNAKYINRRNILKWEDGNQWLRIRHNPNILLNKLNQSGQTNKNTKKSKKNKNGGFIEYPAKMETQFEPIQPEIDTDRNNSPIQDSVNNVMKQRQEQTNTLNKLQNKN